MIIMIIAMLFAASSTPAAARCCSVGGGGSSYDYLGDSSMSIDMQDFDEFMMENLEKSTVSAAREPKSGPESLLLLNLSDGSRIDINLLQSGKGLTGAKNIGTEITGAEINGTEITGAGNRTLEDASWAILAEGRINESALYLNASDGKGWSCEFELQVNGHHLVGGFNPTGPNGTVERGSVEGWLA